MLQKLPSPCEAELLRVSTNSLNTPAHRANGRREGGRQARRVRGRGRGRGGGGGGEGEVEREKERRVRKNKHDCHN